MKRGKKKSEKSEEKCISSVNDGRRKQGRLQEVMLTLSLKKTLGVGNLEMRA